MSLPLDIVTDAAGVIFFYSFVNMTRMEALVFLFFQRTLKMYDLLVRCLQARIETK